MVPNNKEDSNKVLMLGVGTDVRIDLSADIKPHYLSPLQDALPRGT